MNHPKPPLLHSHRLLAALSLILLSVTTDASSQWRRPSLLKRPLHSIFHRNHQRAPTPSAAVVDASDIEASYLKNAVFCVRGGGANGPCIGIDLGKSFDDTRM